MHRQERQAPELAYIALSRSDGAQGHRTELAPIIRPGPHLVTQLRTISINGVPEAVVCRENLAIQLGVGAEV
jgi:hypothetical protein